MLCCWGHVAAVAQHSLPLSLGMRVYSPVIIDRVYESLSSILLQTLPELRKPVEAVACCSIFSRGFLAGVAGPGSQALKAKLWRGCWQSLLSTGLPRSSWVCGAACTLGLWGALGSYELAY